MEFASRFTTAEELRAFADASPRRRSRPTVLWRDAGQVLDAQASKVITLPEARKLLGLPARKPSTRRAG